EINMNFQENVGGVLLIDNYRLIAVEGEMNIPSTLDGNGIDFEDPDYKANLGPFNSGDGSVSAAVIDNPDMTGVNTSAKVGEMNQSADVISWAGVSIGNLLESPIDWSKGRKIQVDVWSPAAGQSINLKLENGGDSNINAEIQTPSTKAMEWETLTFEFPASATDGKDLDKIVLFFNFSGDKSMPTIHYFDNIKQVQ
ncbi:MAG: hypothetical protein AAGM67_03105, partial [Bacteroidota bacterium]